MTIKMTIKKKVQCVVGKTESAIFVCMCMRSIFSIFGSCFSLRISQCQWCRAKVEGRTPRMEGNYWISLGLCRSSCHTRKSLGPLPLDVQMEKGISCRQPHNPKRNSNHMKWPSAIPSSFLHWPDDFPYVSCIYSRRWPSSGRLVG